MYEITISLHLMNINQLVCLSILMCLFAIWVLTPVGRKARFANLDCCIIAGIHIQTLNETVAQQPRSIFYVTQLEAITDNFQ